MADVLLKKIEMNDDKKKKKGKEIFNLQGIE